MDVNDFMKSAIREKFFYYLKMSDEMKMEDHRQVFTTLLNLDNELFHQLPITFTYASDFDTLVAWKLDYMKTKMYIEFPYGKHDEWLPIIYQINQIVNLDGMVALFVDNVPYTLRSALVIECSDEELRKIKESIDPSLIKTDKNIEEFLKDGGGRRWNSTTFITDESHEMFKLRYNAMFSFESENALKKKGYDLISDNKSPKMFISYSWADKQIVQSFSERLETQGFNVFIDKKAIDYGEHIVDGMMRGIDESDLGIIFISNHFKESSMAKTELINLWSSVINDIKSWIIVKLDNVDPNEIKPNLANYKYYDYHEEGEDNLIKEIEKRITKIRNS